MRFVQTLPVALIAGLATPAAARNFTIVGGQIFTPGFAVVDAPQPETPLGGGKLTLSQVLSSRAIVVSYYILEVALDVTANGHLPLADSSDHDSSNAIFNITIFLSSYETGLNLTISNGTATAHNASLGDIMQQELGSTVKHVRWLWPKCLVGNGESGDDDDSDRGRYNISIRQNFRLNDTDHYTIFDLPISIVNSIEDNDNRTLCDALDNPLLSPEEIDAASANEIGILFAGQGNAPTSDGDDDDGDSAAMGKWANAKSTMELVAVMGGIALLANM